VEPNFNRQMEAVKPQGQANTRGLQGKPDLLMNLLTEEVNDCKKHQDNLKLLSRRSVPCNTSARSSGYIQTTRLSSAQDPCMKQLPSGIMTSCLNKQQQQGLCLQPALAQQKLAREYAGMYPLAPYTVRDRLLRQSVGFNRTGLALAQEWQFAGTLPVLPEDKSQNCVETL